MSAVLRESESKLRPMQPADLVRISDIERRNYQFPWSQGVFRDCLLAGYTCIVCETARGIAGYGIISVAAAEAHLLNLCFDKEYRGLGLGKQMLSEILRRARMAGARRILLEVRPSNRTACAMYQKFGFLEVGRRKAYYRAGDGREDAIVLALNFTE